MNGKQAAYLVMERKDPAYIPLGCYAIDCDTAERVIGRKTYVRDKIAQAFALWEGRRDEMCQSLKEDSVELFKKLPSLDVLLPYKEAILLPPRDYSPKPPKKIGDDLYESEDGTVTMISRDTNDVCVVKHAEVTLAEPGEDPPPPDPKRVDEIFEAYDHLVSAMTGERFIFGTSGGFGPLYLPGGMENGLAEYYLNPELMKANINAHARAQTIRDETYIRPGIDEVFIETDFAMTAGPLISPDMFREFCFPAMKARIGAIKTHCKLVGLHCCGNSRKIMDQIIESGVNIYQSLQTIPDMDLEVLLPLYGDKLCFWGGIPVETLIGGTMEEVRMAVRCAIELGKRHGGLIIGPSHSIAYGVKYDNFMALLEEHDKLKWL